MTTTLTPRIETILSRFPSHLDLAQETKTFATVASSLAQELDVQTTAVGRIRKNHRILEVDNQWDLLALVGLHDLHEDHYDVLERRLAAVGRAGRTLLLAPSDADLALEIRDLLGDLVGVLGDAFLPLDDEPDETLANRRLAAALVRATTAEPEMALRRRQDLDTIGIHRTGTTSVASLLEATAAMLAFDVVDVRHHKDQYWHFAVCADRLRLREPQHPGTAPGLRELEPVPDLIAVEENPFKPADVSPAPRPHGQLFAITRAGWEEVPVTVRIQGIDERCMAPMVVNVDTGAGVLYTGFVPDGDEVRFETTGIVTLGAVDSVSPAEVTRNAISFRGAVFASSPAHSNDFVWADASDPVAGGDRAGTFVQTAPIEHGLDPTTVFPHPGGLVQAPTLLVSTSRWAFFVRPAHFGRTTEAGGEEPAVPFHLAGMWNRSVFDPTESDGTRNPSGRVGFDWQEREAFAVCVWIPRRFELLDTEGEVPIPERLRILLDRYRGAGVHVRVKYADDRWTLGVGVTRDPESVDWMGTIVAGTRLWPAPEES
jgi:hypothetical protein